MISYARHFEDARLWKALKDWPHKRYVAIGAGRPSCHSTTKLFDEKGWTGLKLKLSPQHIQPVTERPGDPPGHAQVHTSTDTVNLHAAHSGGALPLRELAFISHTSADTPNREASGRSGRKLVDLLDQTWGDREIGFLHIALEGSERAIIESTDWKRYRPAIVIIASSSTTSPAVDPPDWEPILFAHGYRPACDDGMNRFYTRDADPTLQATLAAPITPLDGFTPAIWLNKGRQQAIDAMKEERYSLLSRLCAFDAERKALTLQLQMVRRELEEVSSQLHQAQQETQHAVALVQHMQRAHSWRLAQYCTRPLLLLKRFYDARQRRQNKEEPTSDPTRMAHHQHAAADQPPPLDDTQTSRPQLSCAPQEGQMPDHQRGNSHDGTEGDPKNGAASEPVAAKPTASACVSSAGSISLCKVCAVEDFCDRRLQAVIRDVFEHECARLRASFPVGFEYRKYWEVAMAVLTFQEAGLLDGQHQFLGVGAVNEPTLFYLTRYAQQVLATDLYSQAGWESSANTSMMTHPEWHWPFYWRPDRLQVQDMNALQLEIEDRSFDAIFSSSSIEHFGTHRDVAQSLDEMYRVLKPGGILSLSTEFRIDGPAPGLPGVLMFTESDINELFIGDRAWQLIEPFDGTLSAQTARTETDHAAAVKEQDLTVNRLGGLWCHHMRYQSYPHILLRIQEHRLTSMHIALRKDHQA